MIVLICEDNKDELHRIKALVSKIDYVYHTYTCKDGQDMIDIAKNNPIDLIITDIDMPNVNGIDAIGKIKNEYNDKIRVIFMTGFPEYSIQSHDYRPIDFLTKPINADRMTESISIAHDIIKSHNIAEQAKVSDTIFIYKFRKSTNMLNYNKILFFEKSGRSINIILDDDTKISYYEDFSKLEDRLPMHFFMSSSKHIINLKKVYKVSPLNRASLEVAFTDSNCTAILNKKLEPDFLYRYHKSKY